MSRFFEDLEAQLEAAARAQTAAARKGDHHPRAPRRRLRPRGGAIAVPLGLAVTVAVVVVALSLHGGSRPQAAAGNAPTGGVPPHVTYSGVGGMEAVGSLGPASPQQQHELTYIVSAQQSALKSAACKPPPLPHTTVSNGSPRTQLQSVLGVLRRPATRADTPRVPHLSTPFYPSEAREVFARYARRARVEDGVSYFVIPVRGLIETLNYPASCDPAQVAQLRSELPRIPAAERAATLALQQRFLALIRAGQQPADPNRDSICFMTLSASGTGGGVCGATAALIARNGAMQSNGHVLSGVVPDGVASVTLHYPASNGSPALTVTTGVAGNVFAASLARLTQAANWPPDIAWRSATGRVIKTISTPQLGTP
jgi:hypothetical protein